jgi:hypothetical protein
VYNDKSTRTYGQIVTVDDAFSIPQRHRRPGPTLCMAAAKRTLEPRRLADMIVLPEDPLSIAPKKLLSMKIDTTIVGGKILYSGAGL